MSISWHKQKTLSSGQCGISQGLEIRRSSTSTHPSALTQKLIFPDWRTVAADEKKKKEQQIQH